jgi:hypothetical protein
MVTGFIFYAGGGLATCSIQVLQWVEGFPWNFKSAGARIAGNSAANDEGRALAARWRDKKCHGGIPSSGVPSPYLWKKLFKKKYFLENKFF